MPDLRSLLLAHDTDVLFLSDVLPATTQKATAAKLFHDLLVLSTRSKGAVSVDQREPYGEIQVEVVRKRLEAMGREGWKKIEEEEEEAEKLEAMRRTGKSVRHDKDVEEMEEEERLEEKRRGKMVVEGPGRFKVPLPPKAKAKPTPRKPKRQATPDEDSDDDPIVAHRTSSRPRKQVVLAEDSSEDLAEVVEEDSEDELLSDGKRGKKQQGNKVVKRRN
jgi:hypothetical protein